MKTMLRKKNLVGKRTFIDGLTPLACLFYCILSSFMNLGKAQTIMIPDSTYYEFAAPKRAETTKLASTTVPFGSFWAGCRYQQVFDASLFTNLPPSGGFVFRVFHRPGCGGRQGTFMTNTVVRMCTTDRRPGELSSVFNENYGHDLLTIANPPANSINGSLSIQACLADPPNPRKLYWDHFMTFTTPFFYNPAKGNLLMELLVSPHRPNLDPDFESFPVLLESTSDLTDRISAVAAEGTNATTAQIVQPTGLVTLFTFAPFPKLFVTPDETNIVVSWPTEPNPTRLQYKDSPDPAVPWKDYNESGIRRGELTSFLEIPRTSLKTNVYFRLYWNSPQVGLPDTTIEIPAEAAPKPTTP